MLRSIRFPKLALFSLTLVLWAITEAGSNLVYTILCYTAALALLWGARFFRVSLPDYRSFWIGIALLSFFKVPAAFHDAAAVYFQPHQQRREDLRALNQDIAIHPQAIFQGHPQRYHVHAPGAVELTITIGSLPPIEATALSHGAFTFDVTPVQTASLSHQSDITVTLETANASREIRLPFIQSQIRPRLIHMNATRDLALSVSTTTHEAILISNTGEFYTVETGMNPSAGMFSTPSGDQFIVSHLHGDGVWWINTQTGIREKTLELAGRINHLAISPDFAMAAVTVEADESSLVLIQQDSLESEALPLPAPPEWVRFGLGGQVIAVTSRIGRRLFIFRKGEKGWQIDQDVSLLRPLTFLEISPDGRVLWGGSTIDDIESDSTEGNHRIVNSLIRYDLEKNTFLRPWITERRTLAQVSPGSYDQGISPMGMDFLEDGTIRVSYAGTSEVIEYDEKGKQLRSLALQDHFLSAPHALGHFGQDQWIVGSPAEGTIGIFERQDHSLIKRIDLNPADPFSPENDPRILERRLGEVGFYESTLAGISCQSCHMHGDSDYAYHDIGSYQAFSTLSAAGVAGTAPYLRDASYPDLPALHEVAVDLYRGYQNDESNDDRAQHLAEYLKSNPGKFQPEGEAISNESVQRGSRVFHNAGCASCHTPPAYTNLSGVPSRRLFSDDLTTTSSWLDTPSLLGLHSSAPYLHDGRAGTLRDLLTTYNAANQHGETQGLTPAELDDLIAFLKQL